MKLVMDERLKHRVIGVAVIISLGAIFAPAMVRKSSQHVENRFSVSVKLPPKPTAPNVAATNEKDMFKTIKVAKLNIKPVVAEKPANQLLKAEPINSEQVAANTESKLAKIVDDIKPEPMTQALQEAAKATANHAVTIAAAKVVEKQQVASIPAKKRVPVRTVNVAKNTPAVKTIRVARKAPAVKPVAVARHVFSNGKAAYAVQLASFSKIGNAQSLVNKLQRSGYSASIAKIATSSGTVYKVYAGHSASKNEALRVKVQIASSMQLNGFVVNTGVS